VIPNRFISFAHSSSNFHAQKQFSRVEKSAMEIKLSGSNTLPDENVWKIAVEK
jgi:hypothetical protein